MPTRLQPADFRYRDENGVMMPFSRSLYRQTLPNLSRLEQASLTERVANYRYPLARYLARVAPDHGVFRFLERYARRMQMAKVPANAIKAAAGQCHIYSFGQIVGINAIEDDAAMLYAEGLWLTPFGGHLHAWNLIHGRVFDVSWPSRGNTQYFGIVFTPTFLRFMWFMTGRPYGFTHKEVFLTCAEYLDNYAQTWRMPRMPPIAELPALMAH